MARQHDAVDIVTIGAGLTAAILASRILPSTGHTMVSIEQGPAQWTYPDFAHNHDALRYGQYFAMMQNLSTSTVSWRPRVGAPALPMRRYGAFTLGSGLGGATAHWAGVSYRFLPTDFRIRSHYEEKYGPDSIPEEMTIQDWPVGYDDLEPYYDAFEYDAGVSGQAGNLDGVILPGGNPFEGPRSRPYPLPPLAMRAFGHEVFRAATEIGLHPFPVPSALLSQGYTDPFGNVRAACLYCGFCQQYGCEVGAKASPQTTWLPPALATDRYDIRTGCRVLGIETADNGRATGVTYVDQDGNEHFQPAELVIASAFTIENVRSLLLARSRAHPDGIGNDRGLVGRNYTFHPSHTSVTGLWESRKFQFFMGNTCTIPHIYDYNGDVFERPAGDEFFVGGGQIRAEMGEKEPVGTVPGLLEPFEERQWGSRWKRRVGQLFDSIGEISVQGESPAYEGHFCDLDPTYTDAFGKPLLRITFDWTENERKQHRFLTDQCVRIMRAMNPDEMSVTDELSPFDLGEYQSDHVHGGAIMGTDPGNSVTNSYGQVWDTPNVFVTGGALFPQNPGSHPTETIAALTYRTADAIRDQYLTGSGGLLDQQEPG